MSHQFAPDVEVLISQHMQLGHYSSQDELLRDALLALAQRNEDLAAINEGLADVEAGRVTPLRDRYPTSPKSSERP